MTVQRIVGHLGHVSVLLLSACVGETCARVRDTADAVEEAARQLALDQSVVTLFAGDTQRLSLRGLNASDDLSAIRWQAADSEIARVDEGRIEALQEGATRVWATIENDSTSAIVVVEPRPPLFVLEPRSVTFDALQESMVLAFIPTGTDPLPDTAFTNACVSDNPGVATVSETYEVRSVGNGRTVVRCTVGHTIDSAVVRVGQRVERVSIVQSSIRAIRLEADSVQALLARVDRLGSPVPTAEPRWRSLDNQILRVDSATGYVYGVALGSAQIVGSIGRLADTARIDVRETIELDESGRLPPPVVLGLDTATVDMPEVDVSGIEIEGIDSPTLLPSDDPRIAAILADGPQLAQTQMTGPPSPDFSITPIVAFAEHRVDIGQGAERTSGPVFGVELKATVADRLLVRAMAFGGDLSAGSGATEDRSLLDVRALLGLRTFPFLDLHVGGSYRSYRTTFATQQWTSLHVGGEAFLGAFDNAMRGSVGVSVMPAITVSGSESPNLGLRAGAGLEYRANRFTLGVRYEFERYDFPSAAGFQRREQFSSLIFNVGLALGN